LPYWKIKLNAKDKWSLKIQTAENTELSGPLSAFAMRKVFFLFYLPCTCRLPTIFLCSNNES